VLVMPTVTETNGSLNAATSTDNQAPNSGSTLCNREMSDAIGSYTKPVSVPTRPRRTAIAPTKRMLAATACLRPIYREEKNRK
jgi:hypothetical protein